MGYFVDQEMQEGHQIIILRDSHRDSCARIVPDVGCNLFQCKLDGHDLIQGPPSLSVLKERSSEFGTPLLLPPGRIRNSAFEYQGTRYAFPAGEGQHHLHGEARFLPWRLLELKADMNGARMKAEFRTSEHMLAYYPHNLVVMLSCTLREGQLLSSLEAVNLGEEEVPFGFGLHPYFSVTDGLSVIQAPAALQYDTRGEGGFIQGEPWASELCGRLVEGIPIGELPADYEYLMFKLSDGPAEFRLSDPHRKLALVLQASREFGYLALFRPAWAEAFSIEPWSQINDAWNCPLTKELTGAGGLRARERARFDWAISYSLLT